MNNFDKIKQMNIDKDTINIVTAVLCAVLSFSLVISIEINLIQTTTIHALKGKEKIYRMQIHHYNPNDYTLKINETY